MSRVILTAQIGYRNTGVSPIVAGTVYIASESFTTKPTDTLANTYFAGRLDGDVSYRLRLQTAFWGGESSIAIGAVEVINDDGAYDSWLGYEWRDHAIVIKQHTSGVTYNSATVLLNAIIERLDVLDEKRLRFVIRDPGTELVVPLTTAAYDNTTDAEGVLKPAPFGQPQLVKPVLIDEATLEYHVSDGTLQSIVTVYDQGVATDFNPVANGFRLIASPAGKITATVVTSGTGNDPTLTISAAEYTVSGEGRSLGVFDDGLSPHVSLEYGFSDVSHTRVSASGGKYYFEMYVDFVFWNVATANRGVFINTSSYGEIATGIQSSAISNPQDVKTAGLYCAAFTSYFSAGASWRWIYAYGNGADIDNDATSSAPTMTGKTIGVKVDFDGMTIEYLYQNTNPDVAHGPHAIAAGTYAPVVGVSTNSRTRFDNVVSIRLIEDDFVYALPSGYSAWSEGIIPDSTFDKFVDSITARLTAVAFDSTSVATINALVHSSPQVEYTYSYYIDQSMTGAKLLSWWASSVGGYWFINRIGEVQVGQLTVPGTSVRTINDTQIIDDISIAPDYARDLSNGLGALRNWSPYRDSEVSGTATEVWKQQITREYQSEYRSATTMAAGYTHATGADMPMSLLSHAAAAQVEADRLATLYAVERKFYQVPIAMDAILFDNAMDEIGQTYTLESDRFGLSGGLDCVLVGIDGGFLDNTLTLTLWG